MATDYNFQNQIYSPDEIEQRRIAREKELADSQSDISKASRERVDYEAGGYQGAREVRDRAQAGLNEAQKLYRWSRGDLTAEEMEEAKQFAPSVISIPGLAGSGAPGSLGQVLWQKHYAGKGGNSGFLRPDWAESLLKSNEEQVARADYGLSGAERERRTKQLSQTEAELRRSLIGYRQQAEDVVDRELDRLLSETGFKAQQARQQTGEGFAERGLGRSSFASNAIGDVYATEYGEKAQNRAEAAQMRSGLTRQQDQLFEGIKRQREAATAEQQSQLESGYQNYIQQLEESKIRQYFSELESSRRISAAQSAQMKQLTSGIFAAGGALGGAALGGPVGAVAGGIGGGLIGGAVGGLFG